MVAACIDVVRREVGDLTPDELDELLREMRRRQRGYMQQGMPAQDAGQKAAQTVTNDLKLAAAIERRNSAINLRVRREGLDFINTQFADNPAEGLTALLAGSNKAGVGTRMSADAVQHALKGQYVGGVIGDLERAGLFEVFADGALDQSVSRALWAIKTPDEFAKYPKPAQQIAKIVRRWQEKARVDANRAGAWIGEADGYIVRQAHDADKLQRAGFERWRDAILPRLDLQKMFPDGVPNGVDLDRYLDESFTGVVSGIHESLSTNAEKMGGFKGPGNIAKKMSQGRKLEFKSADDWFEYNKEFGTGNVREAVLLGLSRSADATGLMRVLGTNPEYNFRALYDAVRGQLREKRDFAGLEKLNRWGNPDKLWGKALLQEVMGRSSAPADRVFATAGTVIRGWNSMTALGGAVLSSVTDIPVRAMELRYQGQNFLGAIAEGMVLPITRLLEGAQSAAERKALLAELGYFSDGVSGLLGARFSSQDGAAGTMSRAQRLFFKASFLTGWTDIFRDASMLATSGHLAALTDLDHAKLPEASTRLLDQYGIGADEWQLLRAATRTLGDKTVMSPQAVREIPAARFSTLARERIDAVKVGLAERIQRRELQDQREQEWVANRSEKLQTGLAEAVTRLNERIAKTEGRTKQELTALAQKLGSLYDKVDTANTYWQTVQERLPSVSKVAAAGAKTERQTKASTALLRAQEQVTQELLDLKASQQVSFESRWDARLQKLQESLAKGGDEAAASARLGEFDQAFTEANAAITDRLANADAAAAKRLTALSEQLSASRQKLSDAQAEIDAAKMAAPKAGELRRSGVTEGRATEAAKHIKTEARQIGRDLERLKKELNEDFVGTWSERQDDLVEFSDRIDSRVRERAQQTAAELGDLDPRVNRILEDTREDVAVKLQTLLSDRMNYAVVSPDARARVITTWGLQRGTPAGEIARAVMQFKSFGVGFTQRVVGREIYGYGARRVRDIRAQEMIGMAQLIASTTAFGYLALTAKDLWKAKKPRNPNDWKTWAAAMQQGGGFGIYGDFLFGEASRFGNSPVETLSGPTVGKGADIWNLIQAAKAGEDPSAKAFRFAVNNTPFINLFYTRLALDYAVFWQIQESLNPGYLRRMERRARTENDQEYLLRPSEAAR